MPLIDRQAYQHKFAKLVAQTYHPKNNHILSFLPYTDNFDKVKKSEEKILYHYDLIDYQRVMELTKERAHSISTEYADTQTSKFSSEFKRIPGYYCFIQIPDQRPSKYQNDIAWLFNLLHSEYPHYTMVFDHGLGCKTLSELKKLDREGMVKKLVVMADPEYYEEEVEYQFKAPVKWAYGPPDENELF